MQQHAQFPVTDGNINKSPSYIHRCMADYHQLA